LYSAWLRATAKWRHPHDSEDLSTAEDHAKGPHGVTGFQKSMNPESSGYFGALALRIVKPVEKVEVGSDFRNEWIPVESSVTGSKMVDEGQVEQFERCRGHRKLGFGEYFRLDFQGFPNFRYFDHFQVKNKLCELYFHNYRHFRYLDNIPVKNRP